MILHSFSAISSFNISALNLNGVTLDFAFDFVEKTGIVPKEFLGIISGVIEAHVGKLN